MSDVVWHNHFPVYSDPTPETDNIRFDVVEYADGRILVLDVQAGVPVTYDLPSRKVGMGIAALLAAYWRSDPDNMPASDARLSRMKRVKP